MVNQVDNEEEILHKDQGAAEENEELEGIATDFPAVALEFEDITELED